ncbi:MAG: DMT family transporter, partial [Firmicutes bacterium]|nr:DMT family transporter [Bacillota bacterium]
MQRFTTPSHTAIMFTSEPVFAAFFAVWLLQETLTSTAYWGGAFIVAGMLLSELRSLPFFEASKDPLPIQGQQE